MKVGKLTVKPFFEPRDLWAGAYIDLEAQAVYLCVFTLGLKVSWGEPAPVPLIAKQSLVAIDALLTELLARGPSFGIHLSTWGSADSAFETLARGRRRFSKLPLSMRVVAELERRGLLK